MKRLIITATLLLLFVASAKAQTSDPVIMHLKSGIELRGHITKNYSDGNIEIKTESGDIFVYRENEILRITVDKEAKKREQEIQRQERAREAELARQRAQEAELARQRAQEAELARQRAQEAEFARQRAQEADQSNVVVTPLFTASYSEIVSSDVQPTATNASYHTAKEWINFGNDAFQKKYYLEAVNCYRNAVELGDALGMNNLGYCYEMGYGVVQDKQKAIELYKKSVLSGSPYALKHLRRLKLIE